MPHRVTELHNIMPIRNLVSVRLYGILSHNAVAALPHADVSMQEVQDKRDKKTVPNGLALHDYANLYFCARNPMMFKCKDERQDLCV
ncbi:MAG: DarT ssDNA thymidine ADP-ribosyltransferase family protein, partial [bacterium]